MDENTKHIVASNLTVAHFARQPLKIEPGDRRLHCIEEQVIESYERFLDLLGSSESDSDSEET